MHKKPNSRHSAKKLALFTFAVAVISALWLTGCATPAPTSAADATIIDVRTGEEYAAGHIQGAININVQASDFTAQLQALPKDGNYVVYCRSGARSRTAAQTMQAAGFTNVTNAGGLDAAAKSLNLPIVT